MLFVFFYLFDCFFVINNNCPLLGGLAKLCSGDGKETRSLADMPRLAEKKKRNCFSDNFHKYNLCYL